MYEGGNDEFTIDSEPAFFPLPPIFHDVNANMGQPVVAAILTAGPEPTKVDKLGPI